jgi:hypothetical protein
LRLSAVDGVNLQDSLEKASPLLIPERITKSWFGISQLETSIENSEQSIVILNGSAAMIFVGLARSLLLRISRERQVVPTRKALLCDPIDGSLISVNQPIYPPA